MGSARPTSTDAGRWESGARSRSRRRRSPPGSDPRPGSTGSRDSPRHRVTGSHDPVPCRPPRRIPDRVACGIAGAARLIDQHAAALIDRQPALAGQLVLVPRPYPGGEHYQVHIEFGFVSQLGDQPVPFGADALAGDKTRSTRETPCSDGEGKFGEDLWEPMLRIDIDFEFVVAAAEVLHEGMPCTNRSGGAQPLETTRQATTGPADGRDQLRSGCWYTAPQWDRPRATAHRVLADTRGHGRCSPRSGMCCAPAWAKNRPVAAKSPVLENEDIDDLTELVDRS